MSQENDKSLRLKNQLEEAMKPLTEKLDSMEKELASLRKEQEKLNRKLNE